MVTLQIYHQMLDIFLAAKCAASAISDVYLPQKSPFKPQIVNFREKKSTSRVCVYLLVINSHFVPVKDG